jgi:hypothetical protein
MFLAPLFLIAAAVGAAVPLILHLMQNRRRVTVPFPTLRFLKMAQKQSSRRIRMENLLLWLLRTLIMILLGMAFAMPLLRTASFAWLGDAPRDVAIVIDASYSMQYNVGRETVWQKSLDTAKFIIEGLGDNDRYLLYLAREQPEALVAEPTGDREQGLNRLTNLKPGSHSSQLAPALTEALKALKKDTRSREREIHIITDSQAIPWQSFDNATTPPEGAAPAATTIVTASGRWDPDTLDDDTTLFVSLLGVPAPENIGLESVDLQPSLVRVGSSAQITAHLYRTGQTADTAVTLFVNGDEIARRPVQLETADGSTPTFTLPALPAGIHEARLETPDDNLPIDNSFHFLVRVADELPSLCVGSQEDTLFVRTALQVGAGDGSTPVRTVPPDRLSSERLGDYACVILCNALPVSGQALTAIEQYVRDGGLLVIFPGMGASIDSYRPWTCLPGFPSEIEEVAWSQRRRTLTWDQPQHPILRPLREAASTPTLAVRRRLNWKELANDANRLIAMGAEQPFLLERPFGNGRVLMFAVAADRTWSDLPLSPFYLPLIFQCIDYSGGFGTKTPYLWATDSLPLNQLIPDAQQGLTLFDPDRKTAPVRSTVVEGRTVLTAEDLNKPGIYTVSTPLNPVKTPALAINIPRREADLTTLPSDQVAPRLGVDQVFLSTDKETLQSLITEHRVGRTYGEHLLWIALILIIIEFVYANFLLKKGPRLSEKLRVDASGHVKGKAAESTPAPAD